MCDTTTTTEEATTMTSLPVELVRQVYEDLDEADFLSLRATCKDLAAKVDEDFLKKHMIERRHFATRHSLEVLVKISERPSLVCKLRTLTIVAAESPEGWKETEIKRYRSFRGESDTEFEQRKRVRAAWLPLLESLENGEDVKLLSTALLNLKKVNVIPSLIMGYAEELDFNPDIHKEFNGPATFGWRHLAKTLGVPWKSSDLSLGIPLTFRCSPLPATTRLMIEAIANAEYPLTSLSLGEDYRAPCDVMPFLLGPTLAQSFSISLTTLKKLEIEFNWDRYNRRDLQEDIKPFLKAMSAAKSLEELKLAFDWDHFCEGGGDDFTPQIGDAFEHVKLIKFELENTYVNMDHLLSFLRHHSETLRDLRLREVDEYKGPGEPEHHWSKLFRSLDNDLSLTHFKFWTNRDEFDMMNGPDPREIRVFDGAEGVKEGLKLLLDAVQHI